MSGVSGRCSETMSLAAWGHLPLAGDSSGSRRQPGRPSSRVSPAEREVPPGVQHVGTHRGNDVVDPFGDIAVADQAHRAAAEIADGFTQCRVRRPTAPLPGSAVQRRQLAQGGQHQQHGAFGHRWRIGAGHIGDRDTALRRGCDVDGVHTGTQLLHQPQPRPAAQVRVR